MLLFTTLFCFVIAEDEFFEPGYSMGGYGELHYTNSSDPDCEGDDCDATTKLDFHRYILFANYNFTPEWAFKSELEIEHNMIDGSGDYDGEVELEQAYINYHNANGNWGFGAGVVLISAGIINETHEPPTFLSVERPVYNSKIIPTTWFGNGAHIYASFGDFHTRFVLHEDLEGEGMLSFIDTDGDGIDDTLEGWAGGIRSARGKGYKTTAYSWTKNFSAHYTGIEGLNIGGSYTMNDAPISDDKNNVIGMSLMEVHASYNANNIIGAFEYGTLGLSHKPTEGDPLLEDVNAMGYYMQLGYNVASMMGWDNCKLAPWFGMGMYDHDDTDDVGSKSTTQFGLTWWPTDQIAWKVDYTMDMTKAAEGSDDSKLNTLSMGVGYMF